MTKTRPEIIISGTKDKIIDEETKWEEYEFYNKVGKLDTRPSIQDFFS